MAQIPDKELTFSLVLHDVAPDTWRWYADFVKTLDLIGSIPITFLVVPNFHRHGQIDHFPTFLREIEHRISKGDEVVIHGYYHDDPETIKLSAKDWFMRRVYTHEGEFYRLSKGEAKCRMYQGIDVFRRLDWPITGFTPPAWLLGKPAREALADTPFTYTTTINHIQTIQPLSQTINAPSMVWSSRSLLRRIISKQWNSFLLQHHNNTPYIRLGIHPVDMKSSMARSYWLNTILSLLTSRTAMTKTAWLDTQT